MPNLSENYHLRKYYLETEQVPTQSVIKNTMTPNLANVYFKSMTPKLKILAGLEPPMKGGGSDWFVPPKDLLKGRTVMKPLKRQYLSKLGFNGIDFFGEKIVRQHHQEMEEEKVKLLHENDKYWKRQVEINCLNEWDDSSKEQAKENTMKIQLAFQQFTSLYMSSINRIQNLLFDAAIKEIERVKEEAFNKMSAKYEILLKQQATTLYDTYAKKLLVEKEKHKKQFISSVENSRTEMGNQLHDINVEKHIAIEKLRVLLECQNLACQVYVALKEREECKKSIQQSKHEHEKEMKILSEKLNIQNFEIRLAQEKEKKKIEFIRVWQKKICHVVKRFQEFVKYCLNALPDHADFFINMEKLMLVHLSETLENPSVESIFGPEDETFHTPVPKPHPFYLFCDKGYRAKVEDKLCPKHCTSSSSQLPVIVVNKKCVYSACDNFEIFAEKVNQLLEGQRGDDKDFVDDHDYTYDIPVKVSSGERLREVKMKSSLLQLLQEEFPNPRNVGIECCVCKVPTCYCESPVKRSPYVCISKQEEEGKWEPKIQFEQRIDSRSIELDHEREPKLESYIDYILPKRCHCAKRVKKHLKEHLPAYMRNVSPYNEPDIPHYKTCTLDALKKLVEQSRGRHSPIPEPIKIESKTRDISTQYLDQEYEFMCTCLSDEEAEKILKNIIKGSKLYRKDAKFKVVDGSLSPTQTRNSPDYFTQKRARSLKQLLTNAPELQEIFKKENCNF